MDSVIRPCGDRAVLVDLPSGAHVRGLRAALIAGRPPGVVDIVPGARSLLVVGSGDLAPAALRSWIRATRWGPSDLRDDGREIPIEVRYDGPDLPETAELLGCSTDEVVARHTSSVWSVAFGGFAPGFAYLETDHERLVVPRRAAPRTSVPAGAVGLAGAYSGVYPRASPGGWQLIGTTDAVLWDHARTPPALLEPGARVRFVAVG